VHYIAFPVQIANTGGQTVNHVVVLGGAAAMGPSNPLSPPPAGPSLPAGFGFATILGSNACTISTAGDSFTCAIGQLSAGAAPILLTVVMSVPTAANAPSLPANIRAWVSAQLNEGSSTSGTNTDTFYAAGTFALKSSTQDYVQTYIRPTGGTSTTDDALSATGTNPVSTKAQIGHTPDPSGDNVQINETGNGTDLDTTCTSNPKVVCFGQASVVHVLQAANIDIPNPSAETFSLANPLKLEFRWDASILPSGVTVQKIQIVHIADGQTTGSIISNFCKSNPPGPNDTLPCRLPAVKYSDKDLGITVYSDSNGNWKPA
jgi:hypothetical protein